MSWREFKLHIKIKLKLVVILRIICETTIEIKIKIILFIETSVIIKFISKTLFIKKNGNF